MKNKVEYIKDTLESYLNKIEYVSDDDLILFLKSPRAYFFSKNNVDLNNNKLQLSIASAVNDYIVGQDLFDVNYIVSEKFDKRTKLGKEAFARFLDFANGKTILSEDEMMMIQQMSISVKMNSDFIELFDNSECEISCYTTDEITGLKIKLRPDVLSDEKNTVVDLRSCLESSPSKFECDVNEYSYSLSAAFYLDFLEKKDYVFAAVEKKPPYQTSLFLLDDSLIKEGRKEYRMALDLLNWSNSNNFWCDYIEFDMLKSIYLDGKLKNALSVIKNMNKIKTIK
jgi:exodeoxyribonuclease VIII